MEIVKNSKDFETMQNLSKSLKDIHMDTELDYKEQYFKIKSLLNDSKETLVYDMARSELNTKITKQCRKIYLKWTKDHILEILSPERKHLYTYLNSSLNISIDEDHCTLRLHKKDSNYCHNSVIIEKATIAEEIIALKKELEKIIFKTAIECNANIL